MPTNDEVLKTIETYLAETPDNVLIKDIKNRKLKTTLNKNNRCKYCILESIFIMGDINPINADKPHLSCFVEMKINYCPFCGCKIKIKTNKKETL